MAQSAKSLIILCKISYNTLYFHKQGQQRIAMEYEIIGFIALGLISGIAAGFFGIGGGTIIVPAMFAFGLPIHHAIGISIIQMVFSSIFGSILNYKKNLLDLRDGILIGLGGLIGASFSGLIHNLLSEVALGGLFLVLTFFSFYRFAFKIKPTISQTPPIQNRIQKNAILIGAGVFTGFFAISLGIGGGLLIAPILGYYLGYDSKKVVPLSLFFVIFSSVSGVASLYGSGIINHDIMRIGIYIGLSSIVGVSIGIYLIHKASAKIHRIALLWIYAFALIVTSVELLYKTHIL